MTNPRRLALAIGVLLGLVAGAVLGIRVWAPSASASGSPYVNTFDYGAGSSPQSIVPANLDVQIHRRASGDSMDAMAAQHGADCGAPPAMHLINTLAEGVFACKNHLMTAIGDGGYGEIALTPDHMADWSSGTTTITFNVSTLQDNNSDWLEVWLVPFADNQTLPFVDGTIDNQGPPKNAIVFSLNQSGLLGTNSGDVSFFSNFVEGSRLHKVACLFSGDAQCENPTGTPSVAPPSAVTRLTYEIDISSGHIKFGLPGMVTWVDTNVSVPFTQAIVQLTHHSYNAGKHSPGTGVDTWHWSNFSISNAQPFTIINGAERSIHAGGATSVHFAAPAPANAFLRFSGLGPQGRTFTVSYDGGISWVSPALQSQRGTADEHFSTYWTPIPLGVQTVLFRGNNWWGGAWWARDPAIWSLSAGPQPTASPTPGPSPTATPSPSPSPAPSPSPSASPSPSPSPSPSAPPSPSPSPSPSASPSPEPSAGPPPSPSPSSSPPASPSPPALPTLSPSPSPR